MTEVRQKRFKKGLTQRIGFHIHREPNAATSCAASWRRFFGLTSRITPPYREAGWSVSVVFLLLARSQSGFDGGTGPRTRLGLGYFGAGFARAGRREPGALPRTLFDNCIGRKRDVGGGFLAGTCRWSGPWRELGIGSAAGTEEILTVTFQNSSRLDYWIRMNVVRRSRGFRSGRMCLELVKNTVWPFEAGPK